jgi:hypothetical protein
MAMFAKLPGPIVGTATGFHPDADWWDIRNKGQQGTAHKALPEHYAAAVIHTNDVKHLLRDVDAEYGDGLRHETCLL